MNYFQYPARIIQRVNIFTLFVLGLMGFLVLVHHKSVEQGGFIFNWSSQYSFIVLLPLFFLWLTQLLFLSQKRFRNLFLSRSKMYQWSLGILILCLMLISMVLKANIYQARILFFILSVLTILLAFSSWFNIKDLMLIYFCFAVLGCLLFAFELPQLLEARYNQSLIYWNKGGTFKYLFEKKPPFIGVGGRLRPLV